MQKSNMADVWANSVAYRPSATCCLLGAAPGEFNVMIPQLRVTLQGAASGRI